MVFFSLVLTLQFSPTIQSFTVLFSRATWVYFNILIQVKKKKLKKSNQSKGYLL